MEWNEIMEAFGPPNCFYQKKFTINFIYCRSSLFKNRSDSKQQYISSKPRKGDGWALGNWRASQKNNGHPDTPSATPQPSATPSDSSATPSLSTPSTPSVSYKYKGHPGGDIHRAVLPKRGPLNI